jgi:glutaminase
MRHDARSRDAGRGEAPRQNTCCSQFGNASASAARHSAAVTSRNGATVDDRSRPTAASDALIPRSPLIDLLKAVHRDFANVDRGEVASYIPELARADPRQFGIAVATVDGEVFSIGDATEPFTIQSISKPLVFGMALAERGREAVLARVGVEPSGNPFNSVTVDAATNRPFNPMVNAGAIVTTALIDGADPDERLERMLETFGEFAGRELAIDERVRDSERNTGDRNRALAWLMKSFGVLEGDAHEIVDLYFGQCSILVTAQDLAVIGATLANDGVNPLTGSRAIAGQHVASMLSVMTTCGMYDNSGEWVFNVGLPAKSGVAGGVLAVLPGQLGIGVFSPPLDSRGNSVRGIGVCERLSRDLQLHVLASTSGVRSVTRRIVRGNEIFSNRVRTSLEDQALAETRHVVSLYELQGDLVFATAEKAHREIVSNLDDIEYVIVDFRYVTSVDEPALGVLNALAETLIDSGRTIIAASPQSDVGIDAKLAPSVLRFVDHDAAIEWCEDRLLLATNHPVLLEATTPLSEFDLLQGLDAAELSAIELAVETRAFESGTAIFREGDVADSMFFLLDGRVNVLLPLGSGAGDRSRRLATFGQGVAFGEMALLDEGRRSADVVSDGPCTAAELSLADLAALDEQHPNIRRSLQANLARVLARRLRAANAQIRALAH